MVWARRLWLRLQTLFRRERVAQRLDDEVQFHLEQQIAENIAAGMSREEARCAAMRGRSEEHTSELQSRLHLVCRLLLETKNMIFKVQTRARNTHDHTNSQKKPAHIVVAEPFT